MTLRKSNVSGGSYMRKKKWFAEAHCIKSKYMLKQTNKANFNVYIEHPHNNGNKVVF